MSLCEPIGLRSVVVVPPAAYLSLPVSPSFVGDPAVVSVSLVGGLIAPFGAGPNIGRFAPTPVTLQCVRQLWDIGVATHVHVTEGGLWLVGVAPTIGSESHVYLPPSRSVICVPGRIASLAAPLACRGKESRREDKQTPPSLSDAQLKRILREYKGNRHAAARDPRVTISVSAINKRIKTSAKLAEFRTLKGRPGTDLSVTDAQLDKLLAPAAGNRTRVEKKAGIGKDQIRRRIKKAQPGSRLYKYKQIKGKGGVTLPVSDQEIARVLTATAGVRANAVDALGMSAEGIKYRIDRSAAAPELVPFRTRKGKPIPPRIVTIADILTGLRQFHGDRTQTAAWLKVSRRYISKAIWNAPDDSELAKYKNVSEYGRFPAKRR